MVAIASHVTNRERAQAHQQDKDRASLEYTGIMAGAAIGLRAQVAALKAYRRGDNPGKAFAREVAKAQPTLRDAMVLGHLTGRARSQTNATGSRKGLRLSNAPAPRDSWRMLKQATRQFAREILRCGRPALSLRDAPPPYGTAMRLLIAKMGLDRDHQNQLAEMYGDAAAKALKEASWYADSKIQEAMAKLTREGASTREGVQRLTEAFEATGLTPANSYTIENLFRTQTQLAYGAGRWNADQAPEIQEILWGYKYVTVDDDRVRPAHAAMDGVTLPKDDPFWQRCYPPNGYSCRCAAISIFDKRPSVEPPDTTEFDGKTYRVEPDKGFSFNPGALFEDTIGMLKEQRIERAIPPASTFIRPAENMIEPPTPQLIVPPAEDRITESYFAQTGGQSNVRVRLADLRASMPDMSDDVFNRWLLTMERQGKAILYGLDDPREIGPGDVKAGIPNSLGDPRHIVYMKR